MTLSTLRFSVVALLLLGAGGWVFVASVRVAVSPLGCPSRTRRHFRTSRRTTFSADHFVRGMRTFTVALGLLGLAVLAGLVGMLPSVIGVAPWHSYVDGAFWGMALVAAALGSVCMLFALAVAPFWAPYRWQLPMLRDLSSVDRQRWLEEVDDVPAPPTPRQRRTFHPVSNVGPGTEVLPPAPVGAHKRVELPPDSTVSALRVWRGLAAALAFGLIVLGLPILFGSAEMSPRQAGQLSVLLILGPLFLAFAAFGALRAVQSRRAPFVLDTRSSTLRLPRLFGSARFTPAKNGRVVVRIGAIDQRTFRVVDRTDHQTARGRRMLMIEAWTDGTRRYSHAFIVQPDGFDWFSWARQALAEFPFVVVEKLRTENGVYRGGGR